MAVRTIHSLAALGLLMVSGAWAQGGAPAQILGTWPSTAFLRGAKYELRSDFEALDFYPSFGDEGLYVQRIEEGDLNPGVFYNPGGPEIYNTTLPTQEPLLSFDITPEEWCQGAFFNLSPGYFGLQCIGTRFDDDFTGPGFFSPYEPFPATAENNFWAPDLTPRGWHTEGYSFADKFRNRGGSGTGLLNSVRVSVGRNSVLDPIGTLPDRNAPADYVNVDSLEHEGLVTLPYQLVLRGDLPDGAEVPTSVPVLFSLKYANYVSWAHPPDSLSSFSCAFDPNVLDCSWGQAESLLFTSDGVPTLEDDLFGAEWAGASPATFYRSLDLLRLETPAPDDDHYYRGFRDPTESDFIELQRTERVVQISGGQPQPLEAFPESVVIDVPMTTEFGTSFFVNLYSRTYARMGTDSAGRLDVLNYFRLRQSSLSLVEGSELFELLVPLSEVEAESVGEAVEGPEDSGSRIVATSGDVALSCAYNGLVNGSQRLTTYFLHRPVGPPSPVNINGETPFLCRNDRSVNAAFAVDDAFLILFVGNKSAHAKGIETQWYRLDAKTGALTETNLEPLMQSDPFQLGDLQIFRARPPDGDGLTDLALWQSDGTPAQTRVFARATYNGIPAAGYQILNSVDEQLYFVALPDVGGAPNGFVWRSDGYPGGTQNIELPASGVVWGSAPMRNGLFIDANAPAARDVYFVANDETLATPVSSWLGSDAPPNGLRLLNNRGLGGLALMYDNDAGGVYVSDGTPAGTHRLFMLPHSIGNDSLNRSALHNGFVYFAVNNTSNRSATFWRTDGTPAGTQAVMVPWSDDISDNLFGEFQSFNGFFAYVRQRFPSSQSYQSELWLMAEEDNHFSIFRNELATAPPLFTDGSVQQLTIAAGTRLYFAGTQEAEDLSVLPPAVLEGLPPPEDQSTGWELFSFDGNRSGMRDPNVPASAPAGSLRPLPRPAGRLLFRNGFEG